MDIYKRNVIIFAYIYPEMSKNIQRELTWLLPTVLLSMVLLYIISWQTDWTFRPGQELEIALHDTFYVFQFTPVAIYVFSHVLMTVYTARLLWSNFMLLKLNLVMLVVYGFVAYINYSLYAMLQIFGSYFSGIAGGAFFMFAITIVMTVVKAIQKRGQA